MKKKKNKKSKKQNNKLIVERSSNESKKNVEKIGQEINELLDGLTVEELSELEEMGDFSPEAIEWIRSRKRRKKILKNQEEFLQRIRVDDETIKRTELVGKIAGIKNGSYNPENETKKSDTPKKFEERMKIDEKVKKKTELIGKLMGLRRGLYKPKSKTEQEQLEQVDEELSRDARIREKEREIGDDRSKSGGSKNNDDRSR